MGCDITSFVEVRNPDTGAWRNVGGLFPVRDFLKRFHPGKDYDDEPFGARNYRVFAFLADVCNSIGCIPISQPRGLPDNISDEVRSEVESWEDTGYARSWLGLDELLDFDYEQMLWEPRFIRETEEWRKAMNETEGTGQSYREVLGELFFRDLEIMKGLAEPANVRVVFWFDN